MYIYVDASQVPPLIEVREPDDFARFHVSIAAPDHAWVAPAALIDLAGRADDEEWTAKLVEMVRFAEGKGWLDDDGRIRAHVGVDRTEGAGTLDG